MRRRLLHVVFMHLETWDRYNYVLEAARVLRSRRPLVRRQCQSLLRRGLGPSSKRIAAFHPMHGRRTSRNAPPRRSSKLT
jgi:hypothetical protein